MTNCTGFCDSLPSWDHIGQDRPVVSVETTMVIKETTSCVVLDWWKQVLRLLARPGGSMETANPLTSMRLTRVPLIPNEVSPAHLRGQKTSRNMAKTLTSNHLALSSAFCRGGLCSDDVRCVQPLPLFGEPGSIPALLSL